MTTKHDRLKANPTVAMFTAKRAAEQAKAHIKIALLHHPFDWLREFDRNDRKGVIHRNAKDNPCLHAFHMADKRVVEFPFRIPAFSLYGKKGIPQWY